MKALRMLLLASSISVCVAGCETTSGSDCDGFGHVPLKGATVAYLVLNDSVAAKRILENNEFGERACGWKALR